MKDKQALIDEWIKVALEDLNTAQLLADQQCTLYRVIAYHSQQYAEKMIKALLIRHEIPLKRTHNLDELLLLLHDKISISDELMDYAISLSGYGVEIRYPDFAEPTKEEALSALLTAKKLVEKLYSATPTKE